MKAVLLSIRPRWCELIASGQKTVEVRRNRPKLQEPFKAYVYCTKETKKHGLHLYVNDTDKREKYGVTSHWRNGQDIVDVNVHLPAYRHNAYLCEGEVIGEFVCDKIKEFSFNILCFPAVRWPEYDKEWKTQLTVNEMGNYMGGSGNGYGWHISALQIYDKPRELREFGVSRAPQSWQYVEVDE